jgi:hypothetical protein
LCLSCASAVAEDQDDTAHDEVIDGFAGGGLESLDGRVEAEWPEDETACADVGIADAELGADAHGVEARLGFRGVAIGAKGDVVAIEDEEGVGREERLHGMGIGSGQVDDDKTFPLLAGRSAALAEPLHRCCREGDEGLDNAGAKVGLEEGDGVADEREMTDLSHLAGEESGLGKAWRREQVDDGEALGGEDLIQRDKREAAAAMQEVGDVRLTQACLACKQGDAEGSTLYSAQQLGPHTLLQLGKVHVENS